MRKRRLPKVQRLNGWRQGPPEGILSVCQGPMRQSSLFIITAVGSSSVPAGVTVLAADYRLAPEKPAPVAHDDALGAYKWALDKGYDANSIALCGDSAGGNLALSVAV